MLKPVRWPHLLAPSLSLTHPRRRASPDARRGRRITAPPADSANTDYALLPRRSHTVCDCGCVQVAVSRLTPLFSRPSAKATCLDNAPTHRTASFAASKSIHAAKFTANAMHSGSVFLPPCISVADCCRTTGTKNHPTDGRPPWLALHFL